MKFELSSAEIDELKSAHRETRERRFAYRINAVILLGSGWTASEVAEALLLDADTVRNYFQTYQDGGVDALLTTHYEGRPSLLSDEQKEQLKQHLRENVYLDVKPIIAYVIAKFGVTYSISGMTKLLHELKFTYKKPKLVPGKADPDKQREWLEQYEEYRKNADENDVFYFVDGVHPQHNSKPAYGWFEEGVETELKSNTGRQRINFNGALNIDTLATEIDVANSINSESMIRLLEKLEEKNHNAKTIYLILDNASYYHSEAVKDFQKLHLKFVFLFLPPYSPNLNLIERLWKFFKKKILYNKYYEKFESFKNACYGFFENQKDYLAELRTLLTENFHIAKTVN